MGATNNIKETNITHKIEGKICARLKCYSSITEQDISENNYEIFFDTSNEVELECLRYKDWHKFSIIIRSIEHQDCPEIETCQRCEKRFLVEIMINPEGNFCSPCYQLIGKDHEPN